MNKTNAIIKNKVRNSKKSMFGVLKGLRKKFKREKI